MLESLDPMGHSHIPRTPTSHGNCRKAGLGQRSPGLRADAPQTPHCPPGGRGPWLAGLIALSVGLGGATLGACAETPPPAGPPELDRATFDRAVYPLLVQDCGFPACHGDPGRFFRVHGPGRSRLNPGTGISAPPNEEEMALTFDRARSMLASSDTPEGSLLLRKPLEVDEGGAPHRGVDDNGRDVYASEDDPRYETILTWTLGGPL